MEDEHLLGNRVVEDAELFHASLNADRKTTLVLLHGILGRHTEFAHVSPHLPDYHLLLPDMPAHSRSSHISEIAIPSQADRIATLVKNHAHNSKAHIVGVSMGGFVATNLALRHPELVESVFVTGAAPFRGAGKWMAEHPSVIWVMASIMLRWIPDWLFRKLSALQGMKQGNTDLIVEMRANLRWETLSGAFTSMLGFKLDDAEKLQVRTLAIAAGRGDDIVATKNMGKRLSVEGSGAVVVRRAIHTWHLQLPDLFSEGVLAWIQSRPLPASFEEL